VVTRRLGVSMAGLEEELVLRIMMYDYICIAYLYITVNASCYAFRFIQLPPEFNLSESSHVL
jgi:hypothetical protein